MFIAFRVRLTMFALISCCVYTILVSCIAKRKDIRSGLDLLNLINFLLKYLILLQTNYSVLWLFSFIGSAIEFWVLLLWTALYERRLAWHCIHKAVTCAFTGVCSAICEAIELIWFKTENILYFERIWIYNRPLFETLVAVVSVAYISLSKGETQFSNFHTLFSVDFCSNNFYDTLFTALSYFSK